LIGTWNNTSINNQYPYAGHFDDPLTPTLDINFGTCKYYFYNDYTYLTNNNMFNTYWNDYAKQIEGGRLVTSKFDLNEVDIRYIKENFNSKIFVLDSYYYVNKITDYNPLKNQVTTVELIKIVEGLAWEGQIFAGDNTVDPGLTASPGPVRPTKPSWPTRPDRPTRPHKDWGYGNDAGYGGFIPGGNYNKSGGYYYSERVKTDWILDCGYWDDEGFWRDNSFWLDTPAEAGCGIVYKNMNLQFIFGDNNQLTANQNYVFGDRNFLGGSNLSVIGGSDNYITTNNVTLIQSQGLTVSEPDTVYLGNSFSVNINNGDISGGKFTLDYGSSDDPSLTWDDSFLAGFWKNNSGERAWYLGVTGLTVSTISSSGMSLNDLVLQDHRYNYREQETSYTIPTGQYTIVAIGTQSDTVFTLPSSADDVTGSGKILNVKNLHDDTTTIDVQGYYEVTGSYIPIDTWQDNGGYLQIDTNTAHGYATGSFVEVFGSSFYSGPYEITSIDSTLLFTVDTLKIADGIVGGETVNQVSWETIDNIYNKITIQQYDSISFVSMGKTNGWVII
jgi:hypothetical protein